MTGPEELEFFTHKEDLVRFSARYEEERRPPGREPLLERQVVLGDAWRAIQYRLPLSARGNPRLYEALEREVGAAVALERKYGPERYGEVFTRVIGFHLDVAEPFVLYRPPAGEPIARHKGGLGNEAQRRVLGQLVVAVRLLAEAGLVHRAITPHTVRWDGRRVQLAEPYATLRTAEPRDAFGAAPWASPEQRAAAGDADARDDLWSVAQLMYFLVSGRPGQGAGPPSDLGDYRQLAALGDGGVFAPLAADRPDVAELMRLLNVPDPLASAPVGSDPLGRARQEFDARTAAKRRAPAAAFGRTEEQPDDGGDAPPARRPWRFPFGGAPSAAPPDPPAAAVPAPKPILCPHCLLPVAYDENRLFVRNTKGEHERLDLSTERRPAHRQDALRQAFQVCPHGDARRPHYLPVPYLTNGEPLTIAMVGSSSAGKTHLLAAMLGEVEQHGLPYGLTCKPLNPDWHRKFLQQKVQRLHQGLVLDGTRQEAFADFADGLLVSGGGVTRPVLFFDLAGEDLARDGEVTRFLMGVGAFIFVLDPLRALRLPTLDPVRQRTKLPQRDLGDEAFTTVLNRVPRDGPYIDAAAAVALNKSDLVRFDPSVDRWLGRPLPPRFDGPAVREESRDAYAFIRHHGSAAWLKPFDDCERCTLHFVAATGGQEQGEVFPHGVRPRRVLAPLLSIFAMCGLLPGPEPREVGA